MSSCHFRPQCITLAFSKFYEYCSCDKDVIFVRVILVIISDLYLTLNHGWPVNHCFKWFFYLHAEPPLRCFLLRPASSTPNHFVWGRRPSHSPYTKHPVKVPHLEIVTSTLSSLFKNAPSWRFEPGALHMKVHHANHQAMEDC